MESTLDTLKLRDMMTVPEPPSPMEAVMKQTMDGLYKKEMAVIEDILRHHIDCPIEGGLTREKVKAAHIRGVMYSENFPQSRIEDNGKDICISVTSGLMGVVQGNWLIGAGGARRPLTEMECDYYERQERMEQMAHQMMQQRRKSSVTLKEGDRFQQAWKGCQQPMRFKVLSIDRPNNSLRVECYGLDGNYHEEEWDDLGVTESAFDIGEYKMMEDKED